MAQREVQAVNGPKKERRREMEGLVFFNGGESDRSRSDSPKRVGSFVRDWNISIPRETFERVFGEDGADRRYEVTTIVGPMVNMKDGVIGTEGEEKKLRFAVLLSPAEAGLAVRKVEKTNQNADETWTRANLNLRSVYFSGSRRKAWRELPAGAEVAFRAANKTDKGKAWGVSVQQLPSGEVVVFSE